MIDPDPRTNNDKNNIADKNKKVSLGYVHPENIPEELKRIPHWILWNFANKDGEIIKVPVDPKTGAWVSAHDPKNWMAFEEALKYSKELHLGIGFDFTKDLAYVFIDWDHVLDHGVIAYSRLREIIEKADTFTEISPSGEGLHQLFKCFNFDFDSTRLKDLPIEIYTNARYSTFTGVPYGKLKPIREIEPKDLKLLLGLKEERIEGKGNELRSGTLNDVKQRELTQILEKNWSLDKPESEGNHHQVSETVAVYMKETGISKSEGLEFMINFDETHPCADGKIHPIDDLKRTFDYVYDRDYSKTAPSGSVPLELKHELYKIFHKKDQKEKKCNSDNCNLENAKIVLVTSFDSRGEHYEQVRNGFATVTEDDRIVIYSHFHTGEYIEVGKLPKDETQVKLEIVYFPLENDQTRTGQIILPQKPERYIGISGIIDEIESLIQKWLYISPEEWPIFRVQVRITVASWFLFVYDDIKIMERVAGLLAIVGTSGGGKRRWLTVLRQFAYRPIYLLNTTKIPSVFRMAEPWGTPTLLIDEADQKETGSEAEWVQFINSRFDGTPIPRYNASGEKVETFKSFGLTCLALRRMPKDEGTTGRMVKINATISPIVLPEVAGDDIFEEFEPIRNKLLYLRLKYYNKLKFVGHSGLPADQSWRGKETLTLFRILEQIDPRISQDINKISQDLTEREVQNLSQTWDGLIINEIYAFITDDASEYKKRKNGYYYFREWTDREGETHTIFLNLKYLADRLGTSASEIQRSMAQFKITTYERFRPDGTDRAQRGILMFGYPQDTDRIFRRYVPGYNGELLKLCSDKQETLAHDGNGNTPNGGSFQTSVPPVPVVPPHDPPNDLSNNNNYIHVDGTSGTSGTNNLNLDLGNQKLEQKSTNPDDNHDWDYFRVTDTFDSYLFRKKKRYSKGNVIKFPIVEAPKYIEKGSLAPACPPGYAWDELEKTCVEIQGGGKNGNN